MSVEPEWRYTGFACAPESHMNRILTLVALLCATGVASSPQPQTPPPPQVPVFRADAHFVRVDAYPSRDGRIIENLAAEDFELLEDGKPQKIDTFQFVRFDAFTTDEERRDPNSQREAFVLAGDPSYRVFVLYLDAYHVNVAGSHNIRQPLVAMLNRMLGPRDLFGVLTPRQRPKDLILGRQSLMIEEQIGGDTNWIWGLQGRSEPEPEEFELVNCFGDEDLGRALVRLRRLDKVMSDLEGLIALLGDIRQERKNILLFSSGWALTGTNDQLREGNSRYVAPPVGVTNAGKLTLGTPSPGAPNERGCQDEFNRLVSIDFQRRHRELVRTARSGNVAFYPVNPAGLEAPGFAEQPPVPFVKGQLPGGNPVQREFDNIKQRTDVLLELANNTDGVAIVNSNDLGSGLQKVASDLSAYYVLGYYTTNTKWDGRIRKISVRLRPGGEDIRARREYRAPTELEMASLRAATAPSPAADAARAAALSIETALTALKRARPSAVLLAHGAAWGSDLAIAAEIAAASIEVGRWKGGGEVEIVVSGPGGTSIGTSRGRIEAGARGVLVRVPVEGRPGPWTAAVRMSAAGEEDQFERLTIAAPAGLVGDPLAFRATPAPTSQLRPIGAFQFRRTERLHIEWPVLKPLDRRDARLLGRDGNPLAIQVTVSERESSGQPAVGIDLNLAPLTAGDYIIELTAGAGSQTDRKLLAFRVVR